MPARSDFLCATVFRTLSGLARANLRGDDATVRRLVSDPRVAGRIVAYGRKIRRAHATDLHVVPSITMDKLPSGELGAGFYLLGSARTGRINAPQTLYLRLRRRTAFVVRDQPGQEW